MRAIVNEEMCEGHGKCQMSAPEVFELGDDDISRVKLDPCRKRFVRRWSEPPGSALARP
jgi:ferredoxin